MLRLLRCSLTAEGGSARDGQEEERLIGNEEE